MSLAGFSASNHPQQTAKRGAVDEVDDRATRPELFDPLDERFNFTLDVAAAPHNAKCKQFYTREQDGLKQEWIGNVWCNPPYSDIGAWVRKAWSEWNERFWLYSIVMLLPANRTEQGWWQDLVEPELRARRDDFRVEFLRGRPRFDRPNATVGPKGDRPPFGCCLLIWDET